MNLSFLPLVNWRMGAILIGVFAIVCIIMIVIVYSLSNGDKNKKGGID